MPTSSEPTDMPYRLPTHVPTGQTSTDLRAFISVTFSGSVEELQARGDDTVDEFKARFVQMIARNAEGLIDQTNVVQVLLRPGSIIATAMLDYRISIPTARYVASLIDDHVLSLSVRQIEYYTIITQMGLASLTPTAVPTTAPSTITSTMTTTATSTASSMASITLSSTITSTASTTASTTATATATSATTTGTSTATSSVSTTATVERVTIELDLLPPVCVDQHSNCAAWAGQGYCNSTNVRITLIEMMLSYCPRTCGVCIDTEIMPPLDTETSSESDSEQRAGVDITMITIASAVTLVWISFMVVVHQKCKLQKAPKGPYLFPPHPDMEPSVQWPSRPGSATMSDVSYSSHWDKTSQIEWDWDTGLNVEVSSYKVAVEDDTYMIAQDVGTETFNPRGNFKEGTRMYAPGRSKFVRNVTDTQTDTEFQNAHELGSGNRLKNSMRTDNTRHSDDGTDIYSLAIQDSGMRVHGRSRGNRLKNVMQSDHVRHSDEGTDIYSLAIHDDGGRNGQTRHKHIQLESNYELGSNPGYGESECDYELGSNNNMPGYGESECDYELGSNNNAHVPGGSGDVQEGAYDLGSNVMHRLGPQVSLDWDCEVDGYDVINPSPTDAGSDYASDTLGGSAMGGSRRHTAESETDYEVAISANNDLPTQTPGANSSEADTDADTDATDATDATSVLAARVATRRRDRSSRRRESHDGSFCDSQDSRTSSQFRGDLHNTTLGTRRMPRGSSLSSRQLSSSIFLPKGQLKGQLPQTDHPSGIDMSLFTDNGVHDQPRDFDVLASPYQMDVYDNLDSFETNSTLGSIANSHRRLTLQEDNDEEEA